MNAASSRERQVREVEAAYDRAWSRGDIDGLLRCFAADAVLVNPRGDVAVGAREIRQKLGTFLASEAAGSQHASTVDRVAFLRDDVAVVDGRAVISSGSLRADLEHPFTDILVESDGRWAIAHVRAYMFGT